MKRLPSTVVNIQKDFICGFPRKLSVGGVQVKQMETSIETNHAEIKLSLKV